MPLPHQLHTASGINWLPRVALQVFALASASALAQTPVSPPVQTAPVTLEKILITGSHIPRVDGETALPLQIITREEIERSGVTTPAQLLQRVPANVDAFGDARSIGNSLRPGLKDRYYVGPPQVGPLELKREFDPLV